MSQKPTDKETQEARDKINKFYDEELPLLRKKKEYFELTALCSEYELKNYLAKIKLLELKNQQKTSKDGESKSGKK